MSRANDAGLPACRRVRSSGACGRCTSCRRRASCTSSIAAMRKCGGSTWTFRTRPPGDEHARADELFRKQQGAGRSGPHARPIEPHAPVDLQSGGRGPAILEEQRVAPDLLAARAVRLPDDPRRTIGREHRNGDASQHRSPRGPYRKPAAEGHRRVANFVARHVAAECEVVLPCRNPERRTQRLVGRLAQIARGARACTHRRCPRCPPRPPSAPPGRRCASA